MREVKATRGRSDKCLALELLDCRTIFSSHCRTPRSAVSLPSRVWCSNKQTHWTIIIARSQSRSIVGVTPASARPDLFLIRLMAICTPPTGAKAGRGHHQRSWSTTQFHGTDRPVFVWTISPPSSDYAKARHSRSELAHNEQAEKGLEVDKRQLITCSIRDESCYNESIPDACGVGCSPRRDGRTQ